MSPVNKLSVLAFASTVLAVPHEGLGHGHVHGHQHLHERHLTGTAAPFPYPSANGTSVWGTTGTGAPTGSSSSQALPETATEQTIQTQTVFQTVSANQAYQSSAAGGEGEQCGVSTVTSTEKVYVTVTGGEAASSSTDVSPVGSSSGRPTSTVHITQTYQSPGGYGSSSSEAAAASSSAPASSAPAYSAPASSSSEASPETTSQASAPAYSAPASSAPASSSSSEQAPGSVSISVPVPKDSAPASSSSAAAVPTAYSSVADKGAEGAAATVTSSAPATSSSSATSSSGKRGLAYNDASLLDCFSGSEQISWAYNWESSAKGLNGFTYIPTLWGTSPTYCDSWSENAKSAISSGSTHLFSFNEPDISSQANLSPADAATGYKTHMNPFAGQAKLCAPAVTNGPASENMGLTWLKQFLSACTDCTIDCLNIHWYDSATNIDYFKQHVTDAISLAGGKPVYISEIGATGSNDQINSFLEEVMPWMDSNDGVAGYAYYMASEGLLVSGSEPSTYGSTYKTYSS
ncbi:glycoside hydrolase family 128 protein [Zasmidium cellare ATCC 36951]|uniref:Glycoside hydrolase family 128 protein n=1 Tax=Zasmidium cellare ATCC 36951 TaxID=1080233 RepID=A0A6A6D4T6_ZASCE|nr:glycoside hydrolase family 128 protein [Zasmidium cellare ATCC 36951]KAF2173428.1 glycoside hydrolase family 128 protein [Zasmidium cellare ATCC 36951]